MKKVSIIIYASLLIISSSFILNTVSATTPMASHAEIQMNQDKANRTLTVVSIFYSGGGPVEFMGNASYPLPPLEIGDKITNCTGIIRAIQPDINSLIGEWEFQGDANLSITSYSYTFTNPNPESNKTPGFEIISIVVAVTLVLFWQRRRI